MIEERRAGERRLSGALDAANMSQTSPSQSAAARRVRLVYFDACPNWSTIDRRLRALAEELGFELELRPVSSPAEVEAAGLHGSPTILVDGEDAFAADGAPLSMSCRMYVTAAGPAGSPTTEQLREVLRG